MKINLLIVEDEQPMIERLQSVNREEANVTLTGVFSNTHDAWDHALKARPDILIADIRLPGESGIDFAQKLKNAIPSLKVIFLTAYDVLEYTKSAIKIGVVAYLLKPIENSALISAVKSAADEVEKDYNSSINENIANIFKDNKFLLKSYFISSISNEAHIDELCNLFGFTKDDSICSVISVKYYDSVCDSIDFKNINELAL